MNTPANQRGVILTVNAGSSSIRLNLFAREGDTLHPLASRHAAYGEQEPRMLLRNFLRTRKVPTVERVGHRVVHGGEHLIAPRVIDHAVAAEIERLAALAPLHNPRALEWVRACRDVLGDRAPQIAVFDTAFYASLPAVAAHYALPRELARRHAIRRYGFHGLAHLALWRRWRALHPDKDGGRVISLQLGAGCSMTAVKDGRPLDTSMGFSPLEGLVMATRSGDVDPGAVTFLQRAEDLDAGQTEELLNRESGLLGLSGLSGDMSALLASDDPGARLAVDLYCYRARKYLGAYLTVLGGVDAVLFGGGVGEHAAPVRERILAGLDWCGITLDAAANRATIGREGLISQPGSAAEIWVIPVDEAALLAREALSVSA